MLFPAKKKNSKDTPTDSKKENVGNRKDNEDTENENNDLKVYVSTPNGLKRVVERTNSQASSNSNAPTLPHKKNMASQNLSPQKKKTDADVVNGKRERNKVLTPPTQGNHISNCAEDLPPPPLPRKPQIQDPLGALNGDHGKKNGLQNPMKYQSLDTRDFDTSRNLVSNSSSGESSPPSSLSAESTNSGDTQSVNSNRNYLGAIPKRKASSTTSSQGNGLHGMAKHMKQNKTSRPINNMPTHTQSEVSSYNVYGNGQLTMNQATANKQTVIKNGHSDQNGYRRGMSSGSTGSSSSPLSTASSSGSTVISR